MKLLALAAAIAISSLSFAGMNLRNHDFSLGWGTDGKHSHAVLSNEFYRVGNVSTGPAVSYRFETSNTSDQLYAGWNLRYDLLSSRDAYFSLDATLKGWRLDGPVNPFNERLPVLVGASFGVRF